MNSLYEVLNNSNCFDNEDEEVDATPTNSNKTYSTTKEEIKELKELKEVKKEYDEVKEVKGEVIDKVKDKINGESIDVKDEDRGEQNEVKANKEDLEGNKLSLLRSPTVSTLCDLEKVMIYTQSKIRYITKFYFKNVIGFESNCSNKISNTKNAKNNNTFKNHSKSVTSVKSESSDYNNICYTKYIKSFKRVINNFVIKHSKESSNSMYYRSYDTKLNS